MRLSTERILTTHVGSLPRSQAVTDVLFAREAGTLADEAAAKETIAAAVKDVVRRQISAGIDVVSDGEMSKVSYATYIADRFTGFAGDTPREPGQDLVEFPNLLKKLAEQHKVPVPSELLETAREMGVKLIPCQMTMDLLGLSTDDMIDGLEEPIGAATALLEMKESDISLFI